MFSTVLPPSTCVINFATASAEEFYESEVENKLARIPLVSLAKSIY